MSAACPVLTHAARVRVFIPAFTAGHFTDRVDSGPTCSLVRDIDHMAMNDSKDNQTRTVARSGRTQAKLRQRSYRSSPSARRVQSGRMPVVRAQGGHATFCDIHFTTKGRHLPPILAVFDQKNFQYNKIVIDNFIIQSPSILGIFITSTAYKIVCWEKEASCFQSKATE